MKEPGFIYSLAFLVMFGIMNPTGCVNVTKVRLQADGIPSVDSLLNIENGALPNLTQITICSRIFLNQSSQDDSPVTSYFASHDNDIYYGVVYRTKTFEFQCCKRRVVTLDVVPLELRKWHHICFAADFITRRYWLAFDELFLEKDMTPTSSDPLQVEGGGRFVIGQELDTREGTFSVYQSFYGDIAQYQLFGKVLDQSYLKGFVRCQVPVIDVEPILSFNENMTTFEISGSTLTSEVQLEQLCQPESTVILLPERRNFKEAQDACSKIKSTIATPESESENTEMWDEFHKYQDRCISSYSTIYWNGVKGDLATGKWLYSNSDEEIMWDKFQLGYNTPTKAKQCSTTGGIEYAYKWYHTRCDLRHCTPCKVSSAVSLNVRGLCRDTIVDQMLKPYDNQGIKPTYYGPYYTTIYWNNTSSVWSMINRLHKDFIGTMEETIPDDYPIGIRTWNITGDKCTVNPVQVLISACNASEYSCNDGSSVQKYQRCNMNADCTDQSDEEGCNIIETPPSYSNHLPPPQMTKGVPIQIGVFLEVMSVREMDILGFKITLDVSIELQWRDRRLRMKNLRSSTEANKVQDMDQIWLPALWIKDGSKILADILQRSKTLMIARRNEPIPDDSSLLHEDDIYLGSENTLVLREVDTLGFTCRFQLRRYPFDTQRCTLSFSLVDVSPDFVILTKDGIGVDYTGQKWLTEYQVTMVDMTLITSKNGTEREQKMEIELRNLYGYYISSTYIPTFLLVIISYLTLFFDIDDFTDRVMVSLTSLLVLSSLFAQTSENTPKTAYLKLIDLWFVCLIVVQFLIVVSLVIIENFRLKSSGETQPIKSFVKVQPIGSEDLMILKLNDGGRLKHKYLNILGNTKEIQANSFVRFSVPIFVLIFLVIYLGFCGDVI